MEIIKQILHFSGEYINCFRARFSRMSCWPRFHWILLFVVLLWMFEECVAVCVCVTFSAFGQIAGKRGQRQFVCLCHPVLGEDRRREPKGLCKGIGEKYEWILQSHFVWRAVKWMIELPLSHDHWLCFKNRNILLKGSYWYNRHAVTLPLGAFFYSIFRDNINTVEENITCCFISDIRVQGSRQLIGIFQGIANFFYVRWHFFNDARLAERRRNHIFAGRYIQHGDGNEGQ